MRVFVFFKDETSAGKQQSLAQVTNTGLDPVFLEFETTL